VTEQVLLARSRDAGRPSHPLRRSPCLKRRRQRKSRTNGMEGKDPSTEGLARGLLMVWKPMQGNTTKEKTKCARNPFAGWTSQVPAERKTLSPPRVGNRPECNRQSPTSRERPRKIAPGEKQAEWGDVPLRKTTSWKPRADQEVSRWAVNRERGNSASSLSRGGEGTDRGQDLL